MCVVVWGEEVCFQLAADLTLGVYFFLRLDKLPLVGPGKYVPLDVES